MRGTRWSESVYDYECGVIVDDEVADLDLDQGRWVRCSSCGRQLQMNSRFGIRAWSKHKTTLRHRCAAQVANEQQDQESPEYAEFAEAMLDSIDKATDYSVPYRNELEKRARDEEDTKKLIRKMALLVTEQEEDLMTLRDDVAELKDIVFELHDTIDAVRQENQSLRRKLRQREDDECPRPSSSRHEDAAPTEIDMFDDNMQLMQ